MLTGQNSEVLSLIDRIYESVDHPKLWPDTIDAIGEFLGSRRGFWTAPKTTRFGPGVDGETFDFFLSRSDLRILEQYADEFGELLVRFLKIVLLSILCSPDQVGGRHTTGLTVARRFLPAFSPDHASVRTPSKSALLNLIAALWEDGQPITAERLQVLRLLTQHLDRALRLQMRLNGSEFRVEMLSGALDRLTLGVILVDHFGMPVWLNRRALEIVGEKDGLRLSPVGLVAGNPLETRHLRELIRSVLTSENQGLLPVSRENDLRPLLVLVFPLAPARLTGDASGFASGVVFISDPERGEDPSIDSLRRAFNLTYREAQTAIAIARGHGLQSAANTMGVAVTTARSQLQQVFAKTGTRHQAELASLVHRTLTQVRRR
ncbi:MAG TPA: helix-turn-helix transcriptional regulator [Alphaproteobacteria bacterium]|nr:helix-turn-helix transcriptional regulator [Alphaproteobacteria bacterium]